jgi:nitrous oxidase accessory protein NosD
MRGVRISVAFLFILAFLSNMNGHVWYVHPDSALNSIQLGLDSCTADDTVLVGPGLYYENIVWPNTQGIDLMSEFGPDTTVIDGDSIDQVITITTVVDTTTRIRGFTIQRGFAPYNESGGGILCDSASPFITENVITNNVADASFFSGGGIACWNLSQAFIVDNVIVNNHAEFGGGGILCAFTAEVTIRNNTIVDNTAWYGGGVFCAASSPLISENTIEDNICDYDKTAEYQLAFFCRDDNYCPGRCPSSGGGICCTDGSSPTIINNTIVSNTAMDGGGICTMLSSSPLISENVISGNTALGYAGSGGGICCFPASGSVIVIKRNTITCNSAPHTGAGIGIYSYSLVTIDSCTISNNLGDGVGCHHPDSLTMRHNNIMGNTGYGVNHTSPHIMVDAEYNWWGHASGPYHPTLNPGGLGDAVSDSVDFNPWLTDSVQGIGIIEFERSPNTIICLQVSPNPFRHLTDIRCQITDDGYATAATTVEIRIYDATGRLVKEFSPLSGITHQLSVHWDGTDKTSRKLPGGVYFVRLEVRDYTEISKIVLLR